MGLNEGMSIDTAGGWPNHFARLTRWKDRSLRALQAAPSNDVHEVTDLIFAYFVWCHSLRDWLVKTDHFDRKVLDKALSHYPIWKVCRDVANRCRHYDLTHNPSDKHWSMGREYDVWARVENRPERLIIFLIFGDQKLDVSEIIKSTFQMWIEILDQVEPE